MYHRNLHEIQATKSTAGIHCKLHSLLSGDLYSQLNEPEKISATNFALRLYIYVAEVKRTAGIEYNIFCIRLHCLYHSSKLKSIDPLLLFKKLDLHLCLSKTQSLRKKNLLPLYTVPAFGF